MTPYKPTASEVAFAADAAIVALRKLGLETIAVGSLACQAYGTSRSPGDCDLVVLTTAWSQEDLKRRLVEIDPSFYLVAAKTPGATYRVLWYSLGSRYVSRQSCKVDLLFPGVMNIPSVEPHRIIRRKSVSYGPEIPLMPILPLLLLKLQAWGDHKKSDKMYMRLKVPQDVSDIDELLQLTVTQYLDVAHLRANQWVSRQFMELSPGRVQAYVDLYPSSAKWWKKLGFHPRTIVQTNKPAPARRDALADVMARLRI